MSYRADNIAARNADASLRLVTRHLLRSTDGVANDTELMPAQDDNDEDSRCISSDEDS